MIRADSYSVTRTMPGNGSSITSMIVSSTTRAFLGTIFVASFGGLFFLAIGLRARGPVCRTLDFAFFGLIGLAAFLTLVLPRLELFLSFASRFLALAMAIIILRANNRPNLRSIPRRGSTKPVRGLEIYEGVIVNGERNRKLPEAIITVGIAGGALREGRRAHAGRLKIAIRGIRRR